MTYKFPFQLHTEHIGLRIPKPHNPFTICYLALAAQFFFREAVWSVRTLGYYLCFRSLLSNKISPGVFFRIYMYFSSINTDNDADTRCEHSLTGV